jgi:hypothetical protein
LAVLIIASDPPSFDLTRIGRCSSNVRGGLVPVLLPSFADIRVFSGVDNFLEARRLGFDFQEEMLPNLRKSSSLTTLGSRSMLTVVYAFISQSVKLLDGPRRPLLSPSLLTTSAPLSSSSTSTRRLLGRRGDRFAWISSSCSPRSVPSKRTGRRSIEYVLFPCQSSPF